MDEKEVLSDLDITSEQLAKILSYPLYLYKSSEYKCLPINLHHDFDTYKMHGNECVKSTKLDCHDFCRINLFEINKTFSNVMSIVNYDTSKFLSELIHSS